MTDTRQPIAEHMEEVSGMWLAKVTGYAGDNDPAQVGSWSGMAVAYGKVAETARREGWVRTK